MSRWRKFHFEDGAKCIFSCEVCVCYTFFCLNPIALAEGGAKGQNDPGQVLSDSRQAVDDSLNYGAIVLCNPGASSIADTESQAPESQAQVCRDGAAPQDSRDSKTASSVADFSHYEDITDISKEDACTEHVGKRV